MRILLTLLMIFLLSCSDETVVIPQNEFRPAVDAIMVESSLMKKAISEKNLFKYSTETDRASFIRSLEKVEAALLKLSIDKFDRGALSLLRQAVKEIQRLQLLKSDNAVLEPFLLEVCQELDSIARIQGVALDDLRWAIFHHDFSDGVTPFMSFGSGKEWETGWSRDRGYVTVGGYGNQAALISPSFDLTSIRNPAFRIKHSISLNQNTGKSDPYDRNLILQGVFKAYVSTNYLSGDPTDPAVADWTEVSLAPLPKGIDFHTVESPEIDLGAFIGDNVTIKLEFDMKDTMLYGRHYATWYVEDFAVLGTGEELLTGQRPRDLYLHEFNNADFSPFHILNVLAGATWQPFGFSEGYVDLAKIQTNGADSESWLLSPRISLNGGEGLELKISEEVRNPVWEKFQILISTDYRGGNPAESTWVELNRVIDTPPAAGAWVKYNHSFDLSSYVGKTVVVGLRYLAAVADEYNVWEVKSVAVRGIGNDLKTYSYQLTYNPLGGGEQEDEPVVGDGGEEFYIHSFATNALSNFSQAVLEGEAVEFVHTTYNTKSYARASGFKTKQIGARLLYTDVDLTGKNDVQIYVNHAINYYSAAAQELNLIRIVAASIDGEQIDPSVLNWIDLEFTTKPAGNSFDPVASEWLTLPEQLQGKRVAVGFIYKTVDNIFPNWDLYDLKLRERE